MLLGNKLKLAALIGLALPITAVNALAALVVRSGSAADVAGITAFRDQFRADLGGGITAGANGLFNDGVNQRREINWDAVPDLFSAPNNLPANFFNVNSPRGVVFSTPGSGFMLSATLAAVGLTGINFGNIDPSYATTFSPFSAPRLFTALGSSVTDVNFFVPGTTVASATRGFGVIFSDVGLVGSTGLQFFDSNGVLLGSATAPAARSGFSFLGAFSDNGTSPIAKVRITSGNAVLGAGVTDNGTTRDLVVMDDFLFSNPAPEPGTLGLVAIASAAALLLRRRMAR